MAGQLKHILGREAARWMAGRFRAAHPAFDAGSFEAMCLDGLERLELMPRARHMADVLARHLPQDFPAAAAILRAALGPQDEKLGDIGGSALWYFPHDCFILKYGIGHPRAAFKTQRELTKRCTCEFSIRAFIGKYPDAACRQLTEWARDENEHVRRLASEGSRPRLPWAPRLRAFQVDPAPVLALLEILKDDPGRYVQRSVANNLNDISKDHPELAVETASRWLRDAGEGRAWIVRHALRGLVKKGHPGALTLMGAGAAAQLRLEAARIEPAAVKIGGNAAFSFELVSEADTGQDLLVDFAVFFIKANGSASPKVFKLKRLTLGAGARALLSGTVSLALMTTRRPNLGAPSDRGKDQWRGV